MIVEFADLPRYRGEVAMVDGCFDPLHPGHVEYFQAAGQLGLPVLCNVTGDDYLRAKHAPVLSGQERALLIDAIKFISYTHLSPVATSEVLRRLRPRYYVKGEDWRDRLPPEQLAIAAQLGIEIVYLPTVIDSSTRIVKRFLAEQTANGTNGWTDIVNAFEAKVLNQAPNPPTEYDEHYFNEEWREHGNSYRVETRRQMEGRHPELIRQVFGPRRVLDAGCGPGALMYLLAEVGVLADGIDISPSSKLLAPPEVRDRITIASAVDTALPENSYDLVICREVIEHLSVLEVRKLVQNLCRVSSCYVYVTTRFHPNPSHLLDITDEPAVDPTHITLMAKGLLRAMFVLEGFRSRPDLERQIDWMNKGRVLVYQKQPTVPGV